MQNRVAKKREIDEQIIYIADRTFLIDRTKKKIEHFDALLALFAEAPTIYRTLNLYIEEIKKEKQEKEKLVAVYEEKIAAVNMKIAVELAEEDIDDEVCFDRDNRIARLSAIVRLQYYLNKLKRDASLDKYKKILAGHRKDFSEHKKALEEYNKEAKECCRVLGKYLKVFFYNFENHVNRDALPASVKKLSNRFVGSAENIIINIYLISELVNQWKYSLAAEIRQSSYDSEDEGENYFKNTSETLIAKANAKQELRKRGDAVDALVKGYEKINDEYESHERLCARRRAELMSSVVSNGKSVAAEAKIPSSDSQGSALVTPKLGELSVFSPKMVLVQQPDPGSAAAVKPPYPSQSKDDAS